MSRDILLKERWGKVEQIISDRFADGEKLDLDSIIYLIGIQEFGKFNKKFTKEEKINLMHIAICKLLEPYGYYTFDYVDHEGWPHYKLVESLPTLKPGEQAVLMKEAIVNYFLQSEIIS